LTIPLLWIILFYGWTASEIILVIVTRTRRAAARCATAAPCCCSGARSSAPSTATNWVRRSGSTHPSFRGTHWPRYAALALMIAGLLIRWTAILSLGKAFSVNVAIRDKQRSIGPASIGSSAIPPTPEWSFVSSPSPSPGATGTPAPHWCSSPRPRPSSIECMWKRTPCSEPSATPTAPIKPNHQAPHSRNLLRLTGKTTAGAVHAYRHHLLSHLRRLRRGGHRTRH
jgi:hypothetical protein